MRKFRVYRPPELQPKPPVYLKLRELGSSVLLEACNGDGIPLFGGKILEITHEGKLYRRRGVSRELGLSLGEERRIVE